MVACVDRSVRQFFGAASVDGRHVDATKLAKIVSDSSVPVAKREEAWRQLLPIIGRIADRVARRWGGDAREYVDDASGYIWQKFHGFDPAHGACFESWCAVVLPRQFVDLHRHVLRDALGMSTTGRIAPQEDAEIDLDSRLAPVGENKGGVVVPLDLRLPFGVGDLDFIRTWDVADRLTLIVAFGMWRKVSPGEWNAWVQEVRSEKRFPFAELERTADLQDRIWVLARFLNRKYNSVYQRVKRKAKTLLPQLRFAREFYGLA
ncbi:MAG: hypothetical protein HZA46_08800 [Planctomycetales bacterium]|nr:hypothetical protein [Planctomycetales bacterium]